MSEKQKTYEDGVEESIELLRSLKDCVEKENQSYRLVQKFIVNKDNYYDKVGVKIREGDFLKMNPKDNDWLDLVIRYNGNLILISELTSNWPIRLKDVLKDSDNPSLVVGNLYDDRIEFSKW